jgi:hypothetical protein
MKQSPRDSKLLVRESIRKSILSADDVIREHVNVYGRQAAQGGPRPCVTPEVRSMIEPPLSS